MFDPIFEFVATILDFFYGIVPNYAVAIIMLTLLVMVITTPLTLKGTRGMIQMQLMQPEIKKIQERHKGGDRQAMNQELMEFYQSNGLNPLGGCLPLLVQAPFFLVMFRVIQGLTSRNEAGTFDPRYLSDDSHLHQALEGKSEMVSFGFDLAESTSDALGESIIHGLPYVILLLVMIGAQYLQQKQVSARNTGGDMMPQQKILLRVMPAFFGVISINFPAALVVYWVTSSIFRIGVQAYITHSLYSHEDSLGAQAARAREQAKAEGGDKSSGSFRDRIREVTEGPRDSGKDKPASGKGPAKSDPAKSGPSENGSGPKPSGRYQPASKKKKKKPRGSR